jgi:hypothetical protein
MIAIASHRITTPTVTGRGVRAQVKRAKTLTKVLDNAVVGVNIITAARSPQPAARSPQPAARSPQPKG